MSLWKNHFIYFDFAMNIDWSSCILVHFQFIRVAKKNACLTLKFINKMLSLMGIDSIDRHRMSY